MSQATRTRRWRLNTRAALTLAAAVAVAVVLFVGLQFFQASRGGSSLLAQARALHEQKPPKDDLALHYVSKYLELRPEDAEALDFKSELLTASARGPEHLVEAIKVADAALRLDPKAPARQATRRRLLELHLRLADLVRELARYRTADRIADQLLDPEHGAPDAAALRLAARVKEGLAALGEKEAVPKAIELFEQARKLDPKDVDGAERLARLYREERAEPTRAEGVLNDLVAANPSAQAYLARYRQFAAATAAAQSKVAADKARDALAQAVTRAPQDPDVLLTAAEDGLRRGDTESARRFLDRLPRDRRADVKAHFLRGMIDLQEGKTEPAIAAWRQGLLAAGGNDIELTWRLAFVYLQLGRLDEAAPLMAQYRRLSGGDRPQPPFALLEAVRLLKQNRPAEAIQKLEDTRRRLGPGLVQHAYYTMAQAYEGVRDEAQALEEYKKAARAAPHWSPPRLAIIRLLQARQPAVAIAELNRALAEIPDDPSLLVALARTTLRRVLQEPPARRDLEPLKAAIERARPHARNSGALALVEADYLALSRRPGDGAALLERAVRFDKTNPELWIALARTLSAVGRLDQAVTVLRQAEAPEACGDRAALRIELARLRTLRGEGKEAREELVRDLDHLPADQRPQVWRELGNFYYAQRDRANARKAYQEWSGLLPEDPAPRLFLLELALAEGDEASAREEIAKLKAQGESLRGLGGIQSLYYRVAEALDLLKDRPGEAPKDRDARLEKAERVIDQVAAEAPERSWGYMLRGQLLERRGRPDEAVAAYEKALDREGGPTAVARLVELYTKLKRENDLRRLQREHGDRMPSLGRFEAETAVRLGDKERAARLARQLVNADPTNLDNQVWLARLLNTIDKPEDAEGTLRDLVARHPDEVGPRLALLYFQVSRRKQADARITADQIKAAGLKLDRPEYFYAQCYQLAGVPAAAESMYRAALAKWPDDPQVVRGASNFYETTGHADKAMACLTDLLARDPKQRWARRARALLMTAGGVDAGAWAQAWSLVAPEGGANTPDDRLARAVVLGRAPAGPRQAAQRQEAIRELERLVEDLPADLATAATARGYLIRLDLVAGRPEQAAALAAQDAGPAAGPAAIALYAEALLRAGKLDEADSQVDRLPADDLATAKLRARVLAARGRSGDEVAAPLEKAYAARRDAPDGEAVGRDVAVALLELKQRDAAERVARELAKKWPATSGLLGTILAAKGQREQALDLYKVAAEQGDPRAMREAVQNAIAVVNSRRDPDGLARLEAVLDAALKREPNAPDLIARQGYLRHFQQRYRDEARLYEQALARRPGDYQFLNNLAWALSEGLHDPKAGLERINEAIRHAPGPPPTLLDTRGVILTRLKQYPEAIRDLEAASKTHPSPTVYFHLARAYREAGRPEDFRRARDAAKKAGLTPQMVEPAERPELQEILGAAS